MNETKMAVALGQMEGPTRETTAARRLSAAIGGSVSPDNIAYLAKDESLVVLKEGVDLLGEKHTTFSLAGGNAAYVGDGQWYKNGKPWTIAHGEKIRPLPARKEQGTA